MRGPTLDEEVQDWSEGANNDVRRAGIGKKDPHLDVGMTGIGCAELPGAALLLPMFVELWLVKDGPGLTLIGQGHGRAASQPLLVLHTN